MTDNNAAVAPKAGRPPRGSADAATTRIIDAATELFAELGFAGTSMEQVASRCGAGKDTVYRRFPSKVALFEAVVLNAHARAIQRLDGFDHQADGPMERLRRLLRELLLINMEPDLIALKRITFSEAVVFGKSGPILPQPDPLMRQLVDAVDRAQQTGVLTKGEPAAIASHLIHCLVALPTSAAMLGSDTFRSVEAIDTHFDQTWDWLINGLKK